MVRRLVYPSAALQEHEPNGFPRPRDGSERQVFYIQDIKFEGLLFVVYIENTFRLDHKRADNLETRNGNTYPTLPMPMQGKLQASYMNTP